MTILRDRIRDEARAAPTIARSAVRKFTILSWPRASLISAALAPAVFFQVTSVLADASLGARTTIAPFAALSTTDIGPRQPDIAPEPAPAPALLAAPAVLVSPTPEAAPDQSAWTEEPPLHLAAFAAERTLPAPDFGQSPALSTEPEPEPGLEALRLLAQKPKETRILKTSVRDFSFYLPGDIIKGTGPTGGDKGALDDLVHAPWLRFPLEKGPAYVNSQVWGWGGLFGQGGGECDRRNYSYPWRDNFCESRARHSGACPGGLGHQGVDIRPAGCDDNTHWAVAVEDGTIAGVGSYGVRLRGESGYEYRYLHVNTARAAVKRGQKVKAGDRIALISNFFNGTPTSIHLHFEMRRPNGEGGLELVSPYASLIPAYLELLTGDREKAKAALRKAVAAPRPKQPPPFTGVAGRGAHRAKKKAVVAEPVTQWCGFAAVGPGSALRSRDGFGSRARAVRGGC